MGAPTQDNLGITTGESLDVGVQYPYAAPVDPRTDGSVFSLAFLDPVDPLLSWLSLASNDGVGSIEVSAWVANSSINFTFRASAQAILQINPNAYTGVLFHRQPRDGAFGPRVTAVATVTLTVSAS